MNKKALAAAGGLVAFGILTASARSLGGLTSSSLGADNTALGLLLHGRHHALVVQHVRWSSNSYNDLRCRHQRCEYELRRQALQADALQRRRSPGHLRRNDHRHLADHHGLPDSGRRVHRWRRAHHLGLKQALNFIAVGQQSSSATHIRCSQRSVVWPRSESSPRPRPASAASRPHRWARSTR